MVVYGNIVENYYQGLDFLYESNQFDYIMESIVDGIVKERLNMT